MSVTVGKAKLHAMMKELLIKWERAQQEWNDPMSRHIEAAHLRPLERSVKNAADAMGQMSSLLARAKRECQ